MWDRRTSTSERMAMCNSLVWPSLVAQTVTSVCQKLNHLRRCPTPSRKVHLITWLQRRLVRAPMIHRLQTFSASVVLSIKLWRLSFLSRVQPMMKSSRVPNRQSTSECLQRMRTRWTMQVNCFKICCQGWWTEAHLTGLQPMTSSIKSRENWLHGICQSRRSLALDQKCRSEARTFQKSSWILRRKSRNGCESITLISVRWPPCLTYSVHSTSIANQVKVI